MRFYRRTLDAPRRNIDVVVSADGKRSLVPMQCRLIPGRWFKASQGNEAGDLQRSRSSGDADLLPGQAAITNGSTPPGEKKPHPWYFTREMSQPVTLAGDPRQMDQFGEQGAERSVPMVILSPCQRCCPYYREGPGTAASRHRRRIGGLSRGDLVTGEASAGMTPKASILLLILAVRH